MSETIGKPDYSGCTPGQLLHYLQLRDLQAVRSREHWIRAAKRALAGDTRELANRVALAESGPVVLTNGDDEIHVPGYTP